MCHSNATPAFATPNRTRVTRCHGTVSPSGWMRISCPSSVASCGYDDATGHGHPYAHRPTTYAHAATWTTTMGTTSGAGRCRAASQITATLMASATAAARLARAARNARLCRQLTVDGTGPAPADDGVPGNCATGGGNESARYAASTRIAACRFVTQPAHAPSAATPTETPIATVVDAASAPRTGAATSAAIVHSATNVTTAAAANPARSRTRRRCRAQATAARASAGASRRVG